MPLARGGRIDIETDIDWVTDFVWVDDYARLEVLNSLESDPIELRRGTDAPIVISRRIFDSLYLPSADGLSCKRRFNPAQGHCLAVDVNIETPDGIVELKAGDAILRNAPGRYSFVPADDYAANYRAVTLRGTTERPPYAFPEIDISERWF